MNLQKTCTATFKAIGDGLTKFSAVITTHAIDRDQDVVIPSGMNSKEYEANPVLLYSHDPNKPIGKMVTMRRGENSIDADFVLAPQTRKPSRREVQDRMIHQAEVMRLARVLLLRLSAHTAWQCWQDRQ